MCELHKFLQSDNPLIKLIVSVAYTIFNRELMSDVLDGCPINVNFFLS